MSGGFILRLDVIDSWNSDIKMSQNSRCFDLLYSHLMRPNDAACADEKMGLASEKPNA